MMIKEAYDILALNDQGSFTIPKAKLYPFQWNWDSGFVALGFMHGHIKRAQLELKTLFDGQWANGMVPHILFHDENQDTYFPNHDFWNAAVNEGAPGNIKTSGISQPPVHGIILEKMMRSANEDDHKEFFKYIFPRIKKFLKFWYQYRDLNQEGLVAILHPWESGRDNSPAWDDALSKINTTELHIPKYQRKDHQQGDVKHRPTQLDYDRYVYLLELGKKHKYQDREWLLESPFCIQDVMLNAVLIRSCQSLIQVADYIGEDHSEFKDWIQMSSHAFNQKLWNEEIGFYTSYDLRADSSIKLKEVGGASALISGLSEDVHYHGIISWLRKLRSDGYYLCPSFDPEHPNFDSCRYWRGPIWPQMNWLLFEGLMQGGYHEMANMIKDDFIALVHKFGFYEYFEASKSKAEEVSSGYGGSHFSWTAACYLDFIYRA